MASKSRLPILVTFAWCAAIGSVRGQDRSRDNPIDRQSLVTRHNVILREADPMAPLSVGNGRFCFTADVTGLQTFPGDYEAGIPLGTLADWAWHSFPNPEGFALADTMVMVDTYGRDVLYPLQTRSVAGQWLRANPHRFSVGRIGLVLTKSDGTPASLRDIRKIDQHLDLWTGVLSSRFEIEGEPVTVVTLVDPQRDAVAVKIESPLVAQGRLQSSVAFAYPNGSWGPLMDDWNKPSAHQTAIVAEQPKLVELQRTMDATRYGCSISVGEGVEIRQESVHEWRILSADAASTLTFTTTFADGGPSESPTRSFSNARRAAERDWPEYWNSGGVIDLSGSRDQRWRELERRIVLSQYLTAIQSRGYFPPQETGLTCNSWHGKFHLEMHWWHSVHFALWGRPEVLTRQLEWYRETLPIMRQYAQRQGYDGCRWGKMLGVNAIESPSGVGPLLVWQQPHPIYYADLLWRLNPSQATLERYQELVFETADFMADFAHQDQASGRFVLGPPLIPAQENYQYATTYNATYELCYWYWGLRVAQQWRERLHLPPVEKWREVLDNLSTLPVRNGIYAAVEPAPFTNTTDHPSMLAALGVLPKTPLVDRATMKATARDVYDHWQWPRTWGWDYPMLAMTAARCNDPQLAIDALFIDSPKNVYLPNGHNYQRDNLPLYLPGNGGLLTAVGMMAAGWIDGPTGHAPGFPNDGDWNVRWEGLRQMP